MMFVMSIAPLVTPWIAGRLRTGHQLALTATRKLNFRMNDLNCPCAIQLSILTVVWNTCLRPSFLMVNEKPSVSQLNYISSRSISNSVSYFSLYHSNTYYKTQGQDDSVLLHNKFSQCERCRWCYSDVLSVRTFPWFNLGTHYESPLILPAAMFCVYRAINSTFWCKGMWHVINKKYQHFEITIFVLDIRSDW